MKRITILVFGAALLALTACGGGNKSTESEKAAGTAEAAPVPANVNGEESSQRMLNPGTG